MTCSQIVEMARVAATFKTWSTPAVIRGQQQAITTSSSGDSRALPIWAEVRPAPGGTRSHRGRLGSSYRTRRRLRTSTTITRGSRAAVAGVMCQWLRRAACRLGKMAGGRVRICTSNNRIEMAAMIIRCRDTTLETTVMGKLIRACRPISILGITSRIWWAAKEIIIRRVI